MKHQISTTRLQLPRTIYVLGFVSLFMDISSELIHSLLPIYVVSVLGASVSYLGIIEGVSEAMTFFVKVFSGVISDYFGKRKWIIAIGYGLSALTKPLFPLATAVNYVFAARFLDRVGKGMRGAPVYALVADITHPRVRGAAYGLRQAMDSLGAVLGPIAALLLMLLLTDNIRLVLWFAVVPGFIAFLLVIFGVEDSQQPAIKPAVKAPLKIADLKKFSKHYWWIVIIGAIFTLARFSEAFLILRSQQTGFSLAMAPLVLAVMSLFFALSSYLAGAHSDKMRSRHYLLSIGLVLLITADLILAFTASFWLMLLGAIFWGLHMGFTQGTLATMIADTAPEELRGTAFGLFNLIAGVFMLSASALAGWLWQVYNPQTTFVVGAILAFMALFVMNLYERFVRKAC